MKTSTWIAKVAAAARLAGRRLRTFIYPKVIVSKVPPNVHADWNLPVKVRDGTTLRVNVFRPTEPGTYPVIMSAHPYGKDRIPAGSRNGRAANTQYRLLPQPEPVSLSEWTNWEAPDPGVWVPRGYVVVNADLRGGGTSEGTGDLRREICARPERDEWYRSKTPAIERIRVPMLVCASFSDHSLHSRGSFEVFRRAASTQKWLYTHRGGKWSTYYSLRATAARIDFFDRFLKGEENGWDQRPPVHLEIHDSGPHPAAIVQEDAWPPSNLNWQSLWLDTSDMALEEAPPTAQSQVTFPSRDILRFQWSVPADIDVIALRQHATRFLKGDILQLDLRSNWHFPRDPFFGQFPAFYAPSPKASWALLSGGEYDSHLLLGSRAISVTAAQAADLSTSW